MSRHGLMHDLLAPIDLRSWGAHIFIDGGTNMAESVNAFYGGAMHKCALHSPNRLYGNWWQTASAAQRAARRSAPTPSLGVFVLRGKSQASRAASARGEPACDGLNVRYIDGLLGTATSGINARWSPTAGA